MIHVLQKNCYIYSLATKKVYQHFPPDRTAHITVFDIPVVRHWLGGEKNINQKIGPLR